MGGRGAEGAVLRDAKVKEVKAVAELYAETKAEKCAETAGGFETR